MKQKIGLFLCLALLLTGCSYQTKTIRFGAADIGGMYYTVANAYAGLASKESSDLKFEVKNTAGSAANLRLLSGNYIDLGNRPPAPHFLLGSHRRIWSGQPMKEPAVFLITDNRDTVPLQVSTPKPARSLSGQILISGH